jgi:hypothetical protein
VSVTIPEFPALQLGTVEELRNSETEIIRRIAATPRGSYLFILSPLSLLKDLNVVLAAPVLEAVVAKTPAIELVIDRGYLAAKASALEPNATVRIKGLFEVLHT